MYHSMEPNAHANRNLWLFCLVISGMVARIVKDENCRYINIFH